MKDNLKVPTQIALIKDDDIVLLEYLKNQQPIDTESGPDYIALILLMMISITMGAVMYV